MKNRYRIYLIFTFLVYLLNTSQAQNQTFSKVYEDVSNGLGLKAYTIIATYDSSYILIGAPEPFNYSNITKINQDGDVIWGKTYNSYLHLNLTCGTATYDSAFVIVGSIRNETTDKTDNFLMKINKSGDTLWTSSFGSELFSSQPLSIEQTIDSGFIISAYTQHIDAPNNRINILKTNSDGLLEWAKTITIGDISNIAYSAKQVADTSYIIIGKIRENAKTANSGFIINLSEDGGMNWAKKMTLENNAMWINDFVTIGNQLLLCFETYNSIGLIKTDSLGNIQWQKKYSVFGYEDYANTPSKKLRETTDNGYIFTYGSPYFWGGVLKTDNSGNVLWHNELELRTREVIETKNHEYLVMGNGPIEGVKGYYQIGLIQFNSVGNSTECSWSSNVQAEEININTQAITIEMESLTLLSSPQTISIFNNYITVRAGCVDFYGAVNDENSKENLIIYPNPNNGIFTIKPLTNKIGKLLIYNSLGDYIYETQINTNPQTIDLSDYSKGVYFYEFEIEGSVINSGKFIIIK